MDRVKGLDSSTLIDSKIGCADSLVLLSHGARSGGASNFATDQSTIKRSWRISNEACGSLRAHRQIIGAAKENTKSIPVFMILFLSFESQSRDRLSESILGLWELQNEIWKKVSKIGEITVFSRFLTKKCQKSQMVQNEFR